MQLLVRAAVYLPPFAKTAVLATSRQVSTLNDTFVLETICCSCLVLYGPLFEWLILSILNRPNWSYGTNMIPLKPQLQFRQSRLQSDNHACWPARGRAGWEYCGERGWLRGQGTEGREG